MTSATASTPPPGPIPAFFENYGWIVVTGIALLFAGIGVTSLGTFLANPDEGIYYRIATTIEFEQSWNMITSNAHPPLYYLTIRGLAAISDSMAWLRAPSVLCSVIAIFGIWRLGRQLAGPTTGVLAAALLVGSPAFQAQAQVARPYATLFMLLVLMVLYLVRAFTDGRWRDTALFGLFGTLAAFTHYSAWPVFGVLGTFLILTTFTGHLRGKRLIRLAVAHVPMVLAVGTLYYTHIHSNLDGGTLQKQVHEDWFLGPLFLTPDQAWSGIAYLFSFLFGVLPGAMALLAFVHGLCVGWISRRRVLAIVPVLALAWGLAFTLADLYPFGGSRHSIYQLLFLIMPMAYGAAFWVDRGKQGAILCTGVAGLGIALGAFLGPLLGMHHDRAADRAGGRPYLIVQEQLTRVETARKLFDELKYTDGFIVMSQCSYLTLHPLVLPSQAERRTNPRRWRRRFQWGKRTLLIDESYTFATGQHQTSQPHHLGNALKRLDQSKGGTGLIDSTSVVMVFSGWHVSNVRSLYEINSQRGPAGRFLDSAVNDTGFFGIQLNAARYLKGR